MKSKKAAINEMVGLGIGITVLAFVAVIGIVVLGNFATSQASCGGVSGAKLNLSTGKCCTATVCDNTSEAGAAGSAYYAMTKVSNDTGGLLTWIPVIIPAVIGIAIVGFFLALRGRKGY